MKNYPLAEKLHEQLVEQWARKMVQIIQENPVEMIHNIKAALDAPKEKEVSSLQMRKLLADIFTSKLLNVAAACVEAGKLMGFVDELESNTGDKWHEEEPEPEPIPLVDEPERDYHDSWRQLDEPYYYQGDDDIPF